MKTSKIINKIEKQDRIILGFILGYIILFFTSLLAMACLAVGDLLSAGLVLIVGIIVSPLAILYNGAENE